MSRSTTDRPGCFLNKITGHADPGRLLAIMGPSGSNKTTLLEALRLPKSSNVIQTGDILVNGRPHKLTFGKAAAAYVTQDDTLIGTLTVFETMWFSASLKFPNAMDKNEKLWKVNHTIFDLGLHDVRNTRVGSWGMKGLSGGETRRLSIAVEILTRPSILFLDEPTSGLDSAAAYFVIRTIRNLAREGQTVLAVVHQPSSEVFQLFHDLLLLSNGRTVFFGEASYAPKFFAKAGYPCPPLRNPSDHYLRCINKDFDYVKRSDMVIRKAHLNEHQGLDLEAYEEEHSTDPLDAAYIKDVVQKLIDAYETCERTKEEEKASTMNASGKLQGAVAVTTSSPSQSSFLMQLRVLTTRSFINMWRDWSYYRVRLIMYIVVSAFIGWVFWHVGFRYQSINGRGACESFVVGFLTFMSIGGFPSFVEDMKVFSRERQNGHYGVVVFILANTLSSLPFLCVIALCSSGITYLMAQLHSGFFHFFYYFIVVFACLVVVESLMMAVAGVVPNFLMGIIVGASIMGVLLLLSGFYRLPRQIPKVILKYPLFYMNFFMYALQGIYKNEFTGLTFSGLEPGAPPISGMYVLKRMYYIDVGRSKWLDMAILWCMVIVYRFIFFLLIKFKEWAPPKLALRPCFHN